MSDSFDRPAAPMRARIGGLAAATVAVMIAAVAPRSALAQATAPALTTAPASSVAPDAPAAAPAAPRRDNPGLIDEIGKLWDKSSSMLPSWPPSAQQPAPGPALEPAEAEPPPPVAGPVRPPDSPPPMQAPPAAAAPSALVPSMVSGKMQCPTAANGAPDCKAGADLLCQSKGFASGKSLSSDSAEACSAKRLLPGRERKPDDCRTNYFVTRAFCQ